MIQSRSCTETKCNQFMEIYGHTKCNQLMKSHWRSQSHLNTAQSLLSSSILSPSTRGSALNTRIAGKRTTANTSTTWRSLRSARSVVMINHGTALFVERKRSKEEMICAINVNTIKGCGVDALAWRENRYTITRLNSSCTVSLSHIPISDPNKSMSGWSNWKEGMILHSALGRIMSTKVSQNKTERKDTSRRTQGGKLIYW